MHSKKKTGTFFSFLNFPFWVEDISECKTFFFVSFFVCVWLKKRRLVVLTVVKPLTIIARAISHKTIYPCKSRARLLRPISLSLSHKRTFFLLLLSPGSRKSCTNFYEALKAPNPSTYMASTCTVLYGQGLTPPWVIFSTATWMTQADLVLLLERKEDLRLADLVLRSRKSKEGRIKGANAQLWTSKVKGESNGLCVSSQAL